MPFIPIIMASGLGNGQGGYSYPANVVDTLFFALGTSSEEGYFLPQECYGAALDALVLPADAEYSLLVQAICPTGEVLAGSVCYPLTQENEQMDSETVIQTETNADSPSRRDGYRRRAFFFAVDAAGRWRCRRSCFRIRYSALAALLTGGAAEAQWENLSLCDISAYGLKVYFHTLLSSHIQVERSSALR